MVDCSPPAQMLVGHSCLSRRARSRLTDDRILYVTPRRERTAACPSTENLANLLIDHPFARRPGPPVHHRRHGDRGEAHVRWLVTRRPRLLEAGLEPGHGRGGPPARADPTSWRPWWASGWPAAVFVPLNDRSPGGRGPARPRDHPTARGPRRQRASHASSRPAAPRPRGRVRHLDVGDDRSAQGHPAVAQRLPRAPGPRAQAPCGEGAPARVRDREPTPNLVPVSVALNAGIYNVCFGLAGRGRRGAHAALRHGRTSPNWSTAIRSARPSCRRPPWSC